MRQTCPPDSMSPLRDGKAILDEELFANGRREHTRATVQKPISDGEKESLGSVASRHQLSTANPLNEKTDPPRPVDTPKHPSVEITTDATPVHNKRHQLCQIPSEQLLQVPGKDRSGLDVSSRLPPTPTDLPIPHGKSKPQGQAEELTFPEGGVRAWLVVLGSFSGMTASFGILNTAGTFQTYLSTHQLAHESPSAVGWIFSLYAFLTFFCGIQIGPVFDAAGPRWLVFAGTVCLVGGMLGVAESTSKWWLPPYIIPCLSCSPAS